MLRETVQAEWDLAPDSNELRRCSQSLEQGLIGKRDSWAAAEMMWDLEAHRDTGVIRFGRNGSTVSSALALIEQGEWKPWAVTYDGSTAALYRNGQPVAQGAFSFGSKTEANMQIGAGQTGGGNPFNGALSEIQLYDRVLSPAEVAGLAGRNAPFYRNP